ncbi:unnamed protein product [Rotaria sp. Silwood2]|nr:unnamed protein product [Rotaria sp. Silwood2]
MMNRILLFICVILSYINLIYSATYQCDPNISCGCSASITTVTSQNVGGEVASDYAWSWIISLQRSGNHTCAATLLTSEYAVTAASCVEQAIGDISELSILAGTNYLHYASSTIIQQRSIIQVVIHPDYDASTSTNDIAILKFSPLAISSDSKIAVICLPKQDEDPFQIDADLVLIGWGYISGSDTVPSNSLQQVTVQAFSLTSSKCQQLQIADSSVQFCAGTINGDQGLCGADNGSPLMTFVNDRWVLAGIATSNLGCGKAGYPGVFTRVSSFISFINSNIDFPVTQITTYPIRRAAADTVQTTTTGMEGNTTAGTGDTTAGTGNTTAGTGNTTAGTGNTTAGTGDTTAGTGNTTAGTGNTTAGTGDTTAGTGDTTAGKGDTTEGTGDTTAGTEDTTAGTGDTTADTDDTTASETQQTTVSTQQTTTVSSATSTTQPNSSQSSTKNNNGNMINKSITVVMVWFSFLAYFFFSF